MAVLLEQTLELFGVPENWDRIVDFYLEAFENVPLPLVERALKHARLNYRQFPKPADLLYPIRDEVRELAGRMAAAVARTAGKDVDWWRGACRIAKERGEWPTSFGPKPGQPGCLVPPEVLAEFNIPSPKGETHGHQG